MSNKNNTAAAPVPAASNAVTAEQIEAWKKKHGKVFCYEVDGEKIYFKQPDRHIIASAGVIAANDPIAYAEHIFKNCFLGGNKALLDDNSVFFGLVQIIDQLLSVKVGELKNL